MLEHIASFYTIQSDWYIDSSCILHWLLFSDGNFPIIAPYHRYDKTVIGMCHPR